MSTICTSALIVGYSHCTGLGVSNVDVLLFSRLASAAVALNTLESSRPVTQDAIELAAGYIVARTVSGTTHTSDLCSERDVVRPTPQVLLAAPDQLSWLDGVLAVSAHISRHIMSQTDTKGDRMRAPK
ncbi:hypothetical protein PG999_006021 [Apiospora kogelbergensis]|uniref:Uncharacterized protein n=1 Tax=Apiospora kogelbergensis TaxID=1337665 RepID=A0AAW0QR06_9PEZI